MYTCSKNKAYMHFYYFIFIFLLELCSFENLTSFVHILHVLEKLSHCNSVDNRISLNMCTIAFFHGYLVPLLFGNFIFTCIVRNIYIVLFCNLYNYYPMVRVREGIVRFLPAFPSPRKRGSNPTKTRTFGTFVYFQ